MRTARPSQPADIRIGNVDVAATVGANAVAHGGLEDRARVCPVRAGVGMVYLQSPRVFVITHAGKSMREIEAKEDRERSVRLNRIVENDLIHRVSARRVSRKDQGRVRRPARGAARDGEHDVAAHSARPAADPHAASSTCAG